MPDFTVDFVQVDIALFEIDKIDKHIQAKLSEMEGKVNSYVQWEGEAKTQYELHKKQWNNSAQQMSENLTKARITLTNIAERYGTTEQRNVNLFDNVRGA